MITKCKQYCLVLALLVNVSNNYTAKGQGTAPVAQRIATNFLFTEGPLWVNGVGLIFSDIQGNRVYRLDSVTNAATSYVSPSGNSNGLALDRNGQVLLAQHGTRGISRLVNGQLVSVATTFRGQPLNSPNDLIVKSDRAIFFTDPPFGIQASQQRQPHNGIYRISPKGVVQLLDSSFTQPNGLAFSPDEKLLYVNENKTQEIYVFDVVRDSLLTKKRLFFKFPAAGAGNADGLKVDKAGYVYSTGPGGVWIFSPDKVVIRTIAVPETVTNVAFGNANRTTLYITAGKSIYRVNNGVVTGLELESNTYAATRLTLKAPNAISQTFSIEVNIDRSQQIYLEVCALNGQSIETIFEGICTKGTKVFEWNYNEVSSGTYLVNLIVEGAKYVQKTVVIK